MVSRAKAEMILKWHRDGYSIDEIARLMKIGEDECRAIILRPELAGPARKPKYGPDFIEPTFDHLF